ncbi:hypothetical protein [Spartinivicinus ruber]|uniref:hypothetical protein n=1 Tax=Spartinivicinus ruber TaxID=2683272 RepID=UPI0013D5EB38|nr:hypothetical protein [Spartinivicinus ruber]
MKKIGIIAVLYSISAVSYAYSHSTPGAKTAISKIDYKNTLENSGRENNEPIQVNYAVLTEEQREALRKFILINLHWL